jgi:hypothetical protein
MNGILFKPEMTKAIIEGRKTQTRRLSGLKEINNCPDMWKFLSKSLAFNYHFQHRHFEDKGEIVKVKPRYHLNEIVYIKEAHYAYGFWNYKDLVSGKTEWSFYYYQQTPSYPVYFNDSKPKDLSVFKGHSTKCGWYLRSPLFLESKFARYFIQITDIKVQRLQEITEEEAIKEGSQFTTHIDNKHVQAAWNERQAYKNIWDSINKEYQWKDNPYVWVYSFQLVNKEK